MKSWNELHSDRYRPLDSNLTDTKPLVIDSEANPQDILECAVQRLRASSDLLQTLYCLCFKHADVEDIPHITHLNSKPAPKMPLKIEEHLPRAPIPDNEEDK